MFVKSCRQNINFCIARQFKLNCTDAAAVTNVCAVYRRGRWNADRDGQGLPMSAPQWNSAQVHRNNGADGWPALNHAPPPTFAAPQQQFVSFAQPPQFDASRMPPRFANSMPFNALQAPNRGIGDFGSRGGGSTRGGQWDNLDEGINRGGMSGGRGGMQQGGGQRWGNNDRGERKSDYSGHGGGVPWTNDTNLTAEDWAKPLPRNDRIEQ